MTGSYGSGQPVWLGSQQYPDPAMFYTDGFNGDGSYVQIPYPIAGAKVRFVNADHSAVVAALSATFESKWSFGPLMRHHRDDSPWSASPPGVTQVEYYRRSNYMDVLKKLETPDMYATAEEIEMPEYDEVVYWSPPGRRIYFNIRDLDPTATYQWFSGFDRTTVYGTEYSVYTTYSYTYPMYVWCKATKGGQVSDTKVVYMLISDSRPELWKAPQVDSLVRELRKLPLPLQNPQWQATYR